MLGHIVGSGVGQKAKVITARRRSFAGETLSLAAIDRTEIELVLTEDQARACVSALRLGDLTLQPSTFSYQLADVPTLRTSNTM